MFNVANVKAQDTTKNGESIGGFFDYVFGLDGKPYKLSSLKLPNAQGYTPNMVGSKQSALFNCSSGYFQLWFEQDWNGIAPNQLNATQSAQAQATICKVFEDISNFIQRPAGSTDKVQIWIRDLTQMGVPNPSSSLIRGAATNFSYVPWDCPNKSGIADNLIWLTINGGKEGFTNIAASLVSNAPVNSTSGYFHGLFGLNFSNLSALPWNLNHTAAPSTWTTQLDLYSVVLHEALHCLGFQSNINANGTSVFRGPINGNNPSFDYFTRYDLNLQNSASASPPNAKLLSTPLSTQTIPNLIYQNTYTLTSAAIKGPGTTTATSNNSASCTNTVNYNTTAVPNMPVYLPSIYEPGASLSHFEDECNNSGSGGSAFEDKFFTMSNAIGNGVSKRALKDQERKALNDIGYTVNTSFGTGTTWNGSAWAATTYTGTAIPGIKVVGYCDGVASGGYSFSCNAGTSAAPILLSTLLANDVNVDGTGTISINPASVEIMNSPGSTLTVTATSVNFTAATTASGVVLIRYVPIKVVGTGTNTVTYSGNITYVYVMINGNCPPNPCNLISNGGFENFTPGFQCRNTVGFWNNPYSNYVNCWNSYSQPVMDAPYCHRFGCGPGGGSVNLTLALPTMPYNSVSNNIHVTTGTSSWNGTSINTSVITMHDFGNWTATNQSIQTRLSSPLVPGNFYTIKLKYNDCGMYNFNSRLTIAGSLNQLVPTNRFDMSNIGIINIDNNLLDITAPTKNNWYNFNYTFQYMGSQPIQNLIIGNTRSIGLSGYPPPSNLLYSSSLMIDDIELIPNPTPITFTPPTTATCNKITNLAQYLSPIPSGTVTFSGSVAASVYQNGAQWDFDPAISGNGNQIISATYSDANGCIINASANIMVANSFPPFSITSNPCPLTGSTGTLTAGPIPSGGTIVWSLNGTNIGSTNPLPITTGGSYVATVTSSGGCTRTAAIFNGNTCSSTLSTALPATIASTPLQNNDGFVIAANTTITGNVTFSATDISIKNGASITVANGAVLTLEASHLHGCTVVWPGIFVSPGGKLIMKGNANNASSFIEDANVAVSVINHTATTNILDITNTVFNKNGIGIDINGYTQNTAIYPFKIENCVFTSRNLPTYCGAFPNWNNVATLSAATTNTLNVLASPYSTLTAYTSANVLGSPEKSNMHIRCTNVGYTGGSLLLPTYTGVFNVNSIGTNTFTNVFDNSNYGIKSTDCNLQVVNSIFQFCKYGIVGGNTVGAKRTAAQQPYSYLGVYPTSTSTATTNGNKFYDNSLFDISAGNFAHLDIVGNEFRSTQSTSGLVTSVYPSTNNNSVGKVAINISNNNTIQHNVKYNTIYNHKLGIGINQTITPAGTSSLTLINFPGIMEVTNNTINTTNGITIGITPFISEGISASMTGGTALANTYTVIATDIRLNIQSNTISNAFRAIDVSSYNWSRHKLLIQNNGISYANEPTTSTTTNSLQFGINVKNSSGSVFVKSNNVDYTGTIPTSVASMPSFFNAANNLQNGRKINYKMDQNDKVVVTCNISKRGMVGFEFNGSVGAGNTKWAKQNDMQSTHFLGFLLNNSGIIGRQPCGQTTLCVSNCPTTNTGNIYGFTANNTINTPKHTWVQNFATAIVCGSTLTGARISAFQELGGGTTRPTANSGSGTSPDNYGNTNNSLPIVSGPSGSCLPALAANIMGTTTVIDNLSALSTVASGLTTEAMSAEINYTNKAYLYALQKSDAAYQSASTELQNFYNASDAPTNNFRKLYDINMAIANSNYTNAQTLNNAFSPANYQETNTKSFNNIYLKYLTAQPILPSDIAQLLLLANKCPHFDGTSVYDARVLYNTIALNTTGDFVSFPDDCNPSGLYKTSKEVPSSSKNMFTADIYPNPTNENGFYLKSNCENGCQLHIIITDITGKLITELDIAQTRSKEQYINYSLMPGTYLISIINNSINEKVVKKLVVN